MTNEGLRWRKNTELPPCEDLIQSPYDIEARYGRKREQGWTGYKTHLTETCDDDQPHLIVNVETTKATVPDVLMTVPIHKSLAHQHRLPGEHWMDSGYLDAQHLLDIPAVYQVDLVGPVSPAPICYFNEQQLWDHQHFEIDWEHQQVTCPAGEKSTTWCETSAKRGDQKRQTVSKVRFPKQTCQICPLRLFCTHSQTAGRSLELLPQAQQQALDHQRQTQQTDVFKQRYRRRAGIEGTISQATGSLDMRQSRYRGLQKTHLQNILTASAINLKRWFAWENGIPLAKTCTSHFKALAARDVLFMSLEAVSSMPSLPGDLWSGSKLRGNRGGSPGGLTLSALTLQTAFEFNDIDRIVDPVWISGIDGQRRLEGARIIDYRRDNQYLVGYVCLLINIILPRCADICPHILRVLNNDG